MSVKQRIKEVREELKLSQVKFSENIPFSDGYIAAIESGRREVKERVIKLICSTYGVNKVWLEEGKGEMFDNELDGKSSLALAVFKNLKPDYQDFVLEQIKDILKLQNKIEENK